MSFLQREYDKLHKICTEHAMESEIHQRAYLAKQAIAWAMDPDCYSSPSALMHKWDGIADQGTKGTGGGFKSSLEQTRGPAEAMPASASSSGEDR